MNLHRFVRWMLSVLLLAAATYGARAQSSAAAIQERLVGHPLYLRDFWLNDQLELKADGKVVGRAQAGPFTRSGIDKQILRAVYDLHFKPATRSGIPVAADFDFRVQFRVAE